MGPQVTFGGVPAWLLTAYLVELGGAEDGAGRLRGEGWTATLAEVAPEPGALRVGRVTVTIEGPAAAETMAALRRKAMRGGG